MSGHIKWAQLRASRRGRMREVDWWMLRFNANWIMRSEMPECEELCACYPMAYGLCCLEPEHEGQHVAVTGLPFSDSRDVVHW